MCIFDFWKSGDTYPQCSRQISAGGRDGCDNVPCSSLSPLIRTCQQLFFIKSVLDSKVLNPDSCHNDCFHLGKCVNRNNPEKTFEPRLI